VKRASLALLGIVALYLMIVLLGALVTGRMTDVDHEPKTTKVLLVGGVIHYDFLLPMNDMTRARFGWLANAGVDMDHPRAEWLVIGWGAHDFYTATGDYTDLRARTIWRGLTGDSAVMRVDLAGYLPDALDPLTVAFSDAQYSAFLDQIENSFAQGVGTKPLDNVTLSGSDRFFAATGNFNFFNTCNVWVGQSLRAAGVKFGAWTPLPASISLSHFLYQRP
jgi:uncharacterized protein (TIGR02117 family)